MVTDYGSPKDRLHHIFLKLQRAAAHIHDLEGQIAAASRAEPYAVKVKPDTDNGVRVWRLVFVKKILGWRPDPLISVTAGEAIYHLRSSLDHALHHLIVANRRTNQITKKTQFPIFHSSADYNSTALGQIRGVSNSIAKIVEREQPYNRTPHSPKDDPLWVLRELNNTDKHRRLSAVVAGIGIVRLYDGRGRLIGTLETVYLTHGSLSAILHSWLGFTHWRLADRLGVKL